MRPTLTSGVDMSFRRTGSAYQDPLSETWELTVEMTADDGTERGYTIRGRGGIVLLPTIELMAEAILRLFQEGVEK